jgi:HD superfamily phosphohydrolase YqeK
MTAAPDRATRASRAMHPIVRGAAAGELPPWAEAGERRVEHMRRVAELLDGWARASGHGDEERGRWRAAGMLHDVLREADPERLAPAVAPELRDLPSSLLHGPAAAARLREEGVADAELLEAIAYHTIGRPGLGLLGRMLYAADFLEPGRTFEAEWRADLRARMPGDLDAVLPVVVAARIEHLISSGSRARAETLAFWNTLAEEGR